VKENPHFFKELTPAFINEERKGGSQHNDE
jgi:hypothetical protein